MIYVQECEMPLQSPMQYDFMECAHRMWKPNTNVKRTYRTKESNVGSFDILHGT